MSEPSPSWNQGYFLGCHWHHWGGVRCGTLPGVGRAAAAQIRASSTSWCLLQLIGWKLWCRSRTCDARWTAKPAFQGAHLQPWDLQKQNLVHQEACNSDQSSGLPEEEFLVLDLTLVSFTSGEAQACLTVTWITKAKALGFASSSKTLQFQHHCSHWKC